VIDVGEAGCVAGDAPGNRSLRRRTPFAAQLFRSCRWRDQDTLRGKAVNPVVNSVWKDRAECLWQFAVRSGPRVAQAERRREAGVLLHAETKPPDLRIVQGLRKSQIRRAGQSLTTRSAARFTPEWP